MICPSPSAVDLERASVSLPLHLRRSNVWQWCAGPVLPNWFRPTRQICPTGLNGVIWRALNRPKIPATKEPIRFNRADNKRPDCATLLPWSHGLAIVWDVTVPDIYAASHIASAPSNTAAAAEQAANVNIAKYNNLRGANQFVPIAIEVDGS